MKRLFISFALFTIVLMVQAQMPKVYDEDINPMEQIDQAVAKANATGRYVVCQVGGNWCKWCLRFADFIKKDAAISSVIDSNYVYIHVNYPRRGATELMKRLNNAGRLGYPVLVVLDEKGNVLHQQDSSFLEQGEGYDAAKVLRFFKSWTPEALKGEGGN